jgi:pimeloyl-ACP methyl ester carboxylesterase
MKRTTVRIERAARDPRITLLRVGFGALGAFAPPLVSDLADRLFFAAPPRRTRSARQAAALATAQPFSVRLGSQRVAAWSWGEGPPVLLVHGWAGTGAQLAAFASPLVQAGHRVVTFDAPGHGASDGTRSSLLDFAEAIHAIAARTGPLAGIVAHSLGSTSAVLAMRQGLDVARAVFIGPPADPMAYFRRFLRKFGVPEALRDGVSRDIEERHHFRWADLDVRSVGKEMKRPLLVLHDEADADVPWTEGAAIADAWPGARFVRSAGLGHFAILYDAQSVATAASFLAGVEIPVRNLATDQVCATPGCGRRVEDRAARRLCDRCSLELELFDRRERWAAS